MDLRRLTRPNFASYICPAMHDLAATILGRYRRHIPTLLRYYAVSTVQNFVVRIL